MARDAYLPKRDAERGGLDFFPTPPDATRSFLNWFRELTGECLIAKQRVWEPACGGGHMSEVLLEYNPLSLISSDVKNRGYGLVADFLNPDCPTGSALAGADYDVIITNPPYDKSAEDFIERACSLPVRRVAMLSRFQFMEGGRRYDRFWHRGGPCRPAYLFLYVARVQMVAGRLPNLGDGGSSIAFSWMVFDKEDKDRFVKFDWVDNRDVPRQLPLG